MVTPLGKLKTLRTFFFILTKETFMWIHYRKVVCGSLDPTLFIKWRWIFQLFIRATWVYGGRGGMFFFNHVCVPPWWLGVFMVVVVGVSPCRLVPWAPGLEPLSPPGPRRPRSHPWSLVAWAKWRLLLLLLLWLMLTSYPEVGSGDLRRNIFENVIYTVLFGSNSTWKACILRILCHLTYG
jgi:hypothetical protein